MMAKLINKDLILITFLALLGFFLRIYDYPLIPRATFTFDEYAFAWSGISLIKNHVPTSWSYLSAYDADSLLRIEWLGKKNLYLATPWFDHPPLFGLIVGAFAILRGATSFWDCTTELIRIPSLIFGCLSIVFFYLVSQKSFNTKIACISTLIFVSDPLFVFLSRLAVSENLLILLSLGSLFYFIKYSETSKKKYFYISTCLASLAPLVKVTGLFLVATLSLILVYNKKTKDALIVLCTGLFAFSLYFLYGSFYDFGLFLSVLRSHSKRFSSILILNEIISSGNLPFLDAWFILGWITLPYTIRELKSRYKAYLISIPIIVYLFILLFSGAQSHFYSWYIIPFYPFIFLSLAKFINDFIKKPGLLNSSIMVAFLGTWCVNYGIGHPWSNFYLLELRGFRYIFIFTFASLLLPIFIQDFLPNLKLNLFNRYLASIFFGACILANILIVFNLKNILSSNLI